MLPFKQVEVSHLIENRCMQDCHCTCKAQATNITAIAYLELLRGELWHC